MIPAFFPNYIEALPAIQILSFYPIPATLGLMMTSKFLAMENNRVLLIGGVMSLIVNISGVIILGTILGIIGVALSLLLSSTVNCMYLFAINRKIKPDGNKSVIE